MLIGDIDIFDEDLITLEDVIITITHTVYVKRLPVTTYRTQRRGGVGVVGMGTKDDDFVEHLFVTNSHHYLLFFTNRGKVYRLKAYEIPELNRTARGTPIINLIEVESGEYIHAVIPVEEFEESKKLFFATRNGIVKKTLLTEYANIRRGGLIAINLRDDDELIDVRLTNGQKEIIMGTALGMSIRFSESDVRLMGRPATGVIGIRLDADDQVIGMDVVNEDEQVLIVTAKGYGKQTPISEYRMQSRGGKGLKTITYNDEANERLGNVVCLKMVNHEDDLMIITASGTLIRTSIAGINTYSRYARGVRLIQIRDDDEVATVSCVEKDDEVVELEHEEQPDDHIEE